MSPKFRPSLTSVIALACFMLVLGGMCVSRSPEVTASPMGTLVDATKHVRDSTDMLPDILFGAGTVAAAVFIGVYFFGARGGDPRRERYKAD